MESASSYADSTTLRKTSSRFPGRAEPRTLVTQSVQATRLPQNGVVGKVTGVRSAPDVFTEIVTLLAVRIPAADTHGPPTSQHLQLHATERPRSVFRRRS